MDLGLFKVEVERERVEVKTLPEVSLCTSGVLTYMELHVAFILLLLLLYMCTYMHDVTMHK